MSQNSPSLTHMCTDYARFLSRLLNIPVLTDRLIDQDQL